jgi:hypothetical protein
MNTSRALGCTHANAKLAQGFREGASRRSDELACIATLAACQLQTNAHSMLL